jgi:hypothetical protein
MPPKKAKAYFVAKVKVPKHIRKAATEEKKTKAMANRAAVYARDRAEVERTIALLKIKAKEAARNAGVAAGNAGAVARVAAGTAAEAASHGAVVARDAAGVAYVKGKEAVAKASDAFERAKPEMRRKYEEARRALAEYKRKADLLLYGTPGRPAVPRSRWLPMLGNLEEAVPAVEGLIPKAQRFMSRGLEASRYGAQRAGELISQNARDMSAYLDERRRLREGIQLAQAQVAPHIPAAAPPPRSVQISSGLG